MPDSDKPRTPAERIHDLASDLARAALDLQELTGLATDQELMQRLAGWCDGHPNGHGAFFEVQYGSTAGAWDVIVFLGRGYQHRRAEQPVNVLKTGGTDLAKALVQMHKLLEGVAPAE